MSLNFAFRLQFPSWLDALVRQLQGPSTTMLRMPLVRPASFWSINTTLDTVAPMSFGT